MENVSREMGTFHIDLNLMAKIENQEMLFGSINYWEGPLRVEGSFDGEKITGVDFMELVGYPSQYTNVKYLNDEIGKTVSRFFSIAKNKAFDLTGSLKKRITG